MCKTCNAAKLDGVWPQEIILYKGLYSQINLVLPLFQCEDVSFFICTLLF